MLVVGQLIISGDCIYHYFLNTGSMLKSISLKNVNASALLYVP